MNERFSVNGKATPSNRTACAEFEARNKALRTKTTDRLDRLTALWRDIEKKLLALQPPHEAYYVYAVEDHNSDPDDPCPNHDHSCIGITKYAGKWRLCLGEYNLREMACYNRPISWCPITDCTLEERTDVARFVKNLEQEIVETGEKMLPKLDEAIRQLEDQLADI